MTRIKKFGGSSLATKERIKNVARQIVDTYKSGHSVVVVVSARGKTTNNLIEQAADINPNCAKRELDMLLVTGEQQSCALMAMAIHSLGCPAISLNAAQAGIISSGSFGNARIKTINTDRIKQELEKKNIVIITGFQGVTKNGEIATLGRGGSDTTAVAVAAALGVGTCEIYTDVEGIYTADPNIVPKAIKLKEISYDEMLELATLGAKVLHSRSVELAKKHNIKLWVGSGLTKKEGTLVKESTMEKMLVSGLAMDKDISKITVVGVKDVPGTAFKLFSSIAKKNIVVDLIIQAMGDGKKGLKDISFTVSKKDVKETIEALTQNNGAFEYEDISYTNDFAKLSIVGAGIVSNPGVASAMFEALYDVGVNIEVISTSEIKISVLIAQEKAEIASRSVHEKLMQLSLGNVYG
ncbi:MAG: aspartate kinase [Defluviitaleaceae bacterium]|nr:aspartate kinase [Defluviitaleaceae bacterium]